MNKTAKHILVGSLIVLTSPAWVAMTVIFLPFYLVATLGAIVCDDIKPDGRSLGL